MAKKELYQAAEAFCGAKLWDMLHDDELYAVRFVDGSIGYCCVMGREGQHYALSLYQGEEGLQTYFALQCLPEEGDPLRAFEVLHGQDCMMCSFEEKQLLDDYDLRELEELGMVPADGRWPMLRRYRPGRLQWFLDDSQEEERLCQALAAGVALRGRVDQALRMTGGGKNEAARQKALAALGFTGNTAPLLERTGPEVYRYEVLELPQELPVRYDSPVLEESFLVARLKKQKTLPNVAWVCDLVMLPTPIPGEPPLFPTAMMILDAEEGFLEAAMVVDFEHEAPGLLDKLIDMLLEQGKPEVLLVDNMRTYALLKGLAEQAQLNLVLEEELSGMAEARQDFLEFLLRDGEMPEEEGED